MENSEIEILANFSIDNKNYVATIERHSDKDDEIFLFEYIFVADDEIELQEIADNIEYSIAFNRFAELCSEDN